MTLSKIDELKNYEYIYTDKELDEILTDYFDVMDISEEKKEKRKNLAMQIRDSLLFLFVIIETAYEYDYLSYDYVLRQFRVNFEPIVLQQGISDSYIEKYIQTVTKGILDTTFKNLDLVNPSFWTSDERAIIIGENEANSILNYEDMLDAKKRGYSLKEWRTERDNRVRKTHRKVDGVKIPIDDYFKFPDCKMLYPHDYVNGSDAELANCRCSLKYS